MTPLFLGPGLALQPHLHAPTRKTAHTRLHVGGLILLWSGYFGPWVLGGSAALTMNAYDLAEWVTFLPGVRDGSLLFGRLHLLGPLALTLLLTGRLAWTLAGGRRWAGIAIALLGGLLLLPGYPFILYWRDDVEVQAQLALFAATWFAIVAAGALSRLWQPGLRFAAMVASVAGFAVAAWTLLMARPAVAALYGAPPPIGWGWAAMLAGFGIVLAAEIVGYRRARIGMLSSH